jgi:AcrR family transcriptional regulator
LYGRAMTETRRRRRNGEVSREKLLDVTAEIAGERGYEGTSINLISERSGLPPSSIYWHFADKDELIGEVIERSYSRWQAAVDSFTTSAGPSTSEKAFHASMRRVGAAVAEFPDFLRLGLLLVLERRPEEPTARRKFLLVRQATAEATQQDYAAQFPELDADDINILVTLTMALADGLFIAQQADEADLRGSFDLLATAVLATADRLAAGKRSAAKRSAAKRSAAKRPADKPPAANRPAVKSR